MSTPIQRALQEKATGKVLSDRQMKRIINEYIVSLTIPKKNKKQIVVCPVGLVGSGKSTVLKLLRKPLNLLIISTDEIRRILMEEDYNLLRTKDIAAFLVLKYAKQGYSVAIDADSVLLEGQRKLEIMCVKQKCNLILIHINTPEEFVKNVVFKSKKGRKLFKDNQEALNHYDRRKVLHSKKNLSKIKFDYIFDISKPSFKKDVAKCIKEIKKEYLFV